MSNVTVLIHTGLLKV